MVMAGLPVPATKNQGLYLTSILAITTFFFLLFITGSHWHHTFVVMISSPAVVDSDKKWIQPKEKNIYVK